MGLCQDWARLWPPEEQDTAQAVCMAESSGRMEASNCATARECSLGLWQVNVLAHPQYDRDRLLSDPDYNARAALEIWQSAGWRAWGAYTAGTYRRYLAGAPASGDTPAPGIGALLLLAVASILVFEVI